MRDVMNRLFGFYVIIQKDFGMKGEFTKYDVKLGWFWIVLLVLFLITYNI